MAVIDYEIRLATESDAIAVWRVHTDSIRDVCSSHYEQDEIQGWIDRQRPEKYLPFIAQDFFVVAEIRSRANEDKPLCGFGHLANKAVQSKGCSEMEVKGLYVDPNSLGRGIGKKLYLRLELHAREQACNVLTVSSTVNAVRFYESCGFAVVDEAVHCSTAGPALRCVRLQKVLSPPMNQ